MTELPADNPLKGAVIIIIAGALIAGTAVLAKGMGAGEGGLSPAQITWGRYSFALVTLLIYAIIRRPVFQPMHLPLHTGRVLAGVTGVTCMFWAATLIPLADATAITFLNPIIAMVLAIWFLREKSRSVRWVLGITAFFGALLLIRPGTGAFQPAALIAL